MFNSLSSKLEATFKQLRNRGGLTEQDIDTALEQIKTALLEADVNFKVVKTFCNNVRTNAIGMKVLKSLNPGQMVIKFVNDELIAQMGKREDLNLRYAPPVIIMLVGLQGSGKTTTCGKLARFLQTNHRRKPLLVPADVYRPAAIEQLKKLGADIKVPVYDTQAEDDPVDIAKRAVAFAKNAGLDTVIIDTAGRLQIDDELMEELHDIIDTIEPHEILLVADAMTGQEAVNVANGFDEQLDLDGLILTKLDGDARGGAALSMRAVTGKPIKFIGMGEKTDALEQFHPERIASRILGMGDVLTLIEKAAAEVSVEDAKDLKKKFKKNEFTLEDFYAQLQTIKKMGSMSSLMGMIPGMGKVTAKLDDEKVDGDLKRLEAIILSMTIEERRDHELINGSRKKRIAQGSGNSIEAINQLLKQFSEMRKMMKKLSKAGPGGLRGLGGMLKGGGMPPGFPK